MYEDLSTALEVYQKCEPGPHRIVWKIKNMPTNSKFLETVYSLNYSILGDIVVAHSFKRTHIKWK